MNAFRPLSLLALASCALSAHANLLGSTVNARFATSTLDLVDYGNALVVDPGVEYPMADNGGFSFDFTNTTLTITNISNGGIYYGISDLGYAFTVVSGSAFTGVSFVSGVAPASASVTAGRLYINYGDTGFRPGESSVFSLTTASPAAPGPAAMGPFALGALASLRKRRRA